MKVYYFSYAIKEDTINKIYTLGQFPGFQVQVFNRSIINGLIKNGYDVTCDTNIPVSKNLIKETFLTVPNEDIYEYHKVINIPLIKDLIILVRTYFKMCKRLKKEKAICMGDILSVPNNLGAALACKKYNRPFIGIITDVPDFIENNSIYLKMTEQVIKNCSHYVFLTEPMNELINTERKPYVVMEGSCTLFPLLENLQREKCFVYTGSLDEFNGIKNLVDAFVQLDTDYELHLYGNGSYTETIKEISKTNSNIHYKGMIPHEEVVKVIQKASFLVNPRTLNDQQIAYSFPSKTFDYLASNTPVISTKLPCLSEEYTQYMNFFDSDSVEAMKKGLESILLSNYEVLLNKAYQARLFIQDNKNNVIQAEKIMQLVK
ncbi:MAG: glycosyltransferase [Erysipelotrichaceae bacterium]|nr:glycosyltransferase [Erysipelotrichaceae bacterium]